VISLLPAGRWARALSGEKLAAVRFFVPSDFLLTQIPEKKRDRRREGWLYLGHRGWGLRDGGRRAPRCRVRVGGGEADKRERKGRDVSEAEKDGKGRRREGEETLRWKRKENESGGTSPRDERPAGRREGEGDAERRAAGGRKKGQRTQLTATERQSCAHFFSWPNPKTLLCPPKINYPPYSKNETGREQRNAARATRRSSRARDQPLSSIAVHSRPIQRGLSRDEVFSTHETPCHEIFPQVSRPTSRVLGPAFASELGAESLEFPITVTIPAKKQHPESVSSRASLRTWTRRSMRREKRRA